MSSSRVSEFTVEGADTLKLSDRGLRVSGLQDCFLLPTQHIKWIWSIWECGCLHVFHGVVLATTTYARISLTEGEVIALTKPE